jgi:hypothetical protein
VVIGMDVRLAGPSSASTTAPSLSTRPRLCAERRLRVTTNASDTRWPIRAAGQPDPVGQSHHEHDPGGRDESRSVRLGLLPIANTRLG